MEKYMDASVMTQEDRVVYVAFQLKGLADIWWEGVRAAWTPAHGPPTWDVFVKQFTSKYYPDSFKEKMDVALRNMKQGDKTVDEYEMEFSKIVHFVDHINQNEGEKARRFFEGLNSECRHVMGANRPNEYFTVVQARGMELQIELTQQRQLVQVVLVAQVASTREVIRMGVSLLSVLFSRSPSRMDNLNPYLDRGHNFLQGQNSCALLRGKD
ncbi:hypothetical protein QYE76_053072 [Lolium multiflorum]|uniref:Retrotransposon gag domain-containing protein n=1 Tax=Lolium multiflorum TaxID=4521 RepID=A0AAD8WLL9_LOLMU|nr:hypothetical protein QYE76_053072 [Lolium multiflorum]